MANAPITQESEEWKPILGLEGQYEASSLGRIKRLARWVSARSGGKRFHPAKVTEGFASKKGYRRIKIFKQNGEVHRLVCLAFHGKPPSDKHHAAHANDVKDDNRAANLRWATPKENAEDRISNGLQVRGEQVTTGRLTAAQVIQIRAEHEGRYGQTKELSEKFGVGFGAIIAVVKRRSWTHI